MNLVEDKIVHLLTGKPNLSQVTVDELLAITDEQPFFSVAQLLLTQKMKQVNHPGFTHQLQKTALFFPNTFWLDQHLQQQPEPAGYQSAAPAATYAPPPPAPVPPTPPPAPSYESNPYAPQGYTPPASVNTGQEKQQEQPWYANPVQQQYQPAPAPPPAPATPAPEPWAPAATQEPKPALSINDAYAAYLPQQDVLAKVASPEPAAATQQQATPPASSYTPAADYTPASTYTPAGSYTPASSYNTPDTDNKKTESAYTPASSYAPADYQPPVTPAAPPPPAAEEKPWYANPVYQQPITTTDAAVLPLPETKAAPSANDAFAAYMPQSSSAPAANDTGSSYTPAYTPPPVEPAPAPPPAYTSSYAPAPAADNYTPTPPAASNPFGPVAEEKPKVYDPWYTNPIYQQPYQAEEGSTSSAAEMSTSLPEVTVPAADNIAETQEENVIPVTAAAPEIPVPVAETTVPEITAAIAPVAEPEVAEPVTEIAAPEMVTEPEAPEVMVTPEVVAAIPAAPEASAPEPVQEASPAVSTPPPPPASAPVAPSTAGGYRLSRPPVIETSDDTAASAAPMSIVEIAEAASAQEEDNTFSTDQDFAAAGIVAVTSGSQEEVLPPLDDNTDAPENMPAEAEDSMSSMRLSEMLQSQAASFSKPLEESAKLPFGLEPYMIDYFASQGINLEEMLEASADDTLGKKVRKFTDWLRQMRRISPHPSDLGTDKAQEQEVQGIAALSIEAREILTESMADVLVKQGKFDKAIQLYSKLSFLNPAKTAYFASKIIETSKLSGK